MDSQRKIEDTMVQFEWTSEEKRRVRMIRRRCVLYRRRGEVGGSRKGNSETKA